MTQLKLLQCGHFLILSRVPDENGNLIINSEIQNANLTNSLLVSVKAGMLNAEDSILIHSALRNAELKNSLAYNLIENGPLVLENEQKVSVSIMDKLLNLKTSEGRDGGEDWHQKLPDNEFSYDEIYKMNDGSDENDQISELWQKWLIDGDH